MEPRRRDRLARLVLLDAVGRYLGEAAAFEIGDCLDLVGEIGAPAAYD
jgi:hypothetical protein